MLTYYPAVIPTLVVGEKESDVLLLLRPAQFPFSLSLVIANVFAASVGRNPF